MNFLKKYQTIIVMTSSTLSLSFAITIFLTFFDERSFITMSIISNILVIFTSTFLLIPSLLWFLRFWKKNEKKNSFVSLLYLIYLSLNVFIWFKFFIQSHIIDWWIFLIIMNLPASIFITILLSFIDGEMERFEKFLFSLTINTIIFSWIWYILIWLYSELNRNNINKSNYNYTCNDNSKITVMKYSNEKNIIYFIENNSYVKLKDVTLQNKFYMNENIKYLKLSETNIKITSDEIEKECNLVSIQNWDWNLFSANSKKIIKKEIKNFDEPFTEEQYKNNCINARWKWNNYNKICNF